MNININEVKRLLDSQYQELECGDDNVKFNVLYNIIVTKKDFNIISYHNSLYIDIKKFIYAYIKATQSLDYGYDAINNNKIKEVVSFLTPKEQLSIYHILRTSYTNLGLETNWIHNSLKRVEISIAKKEKRCTVFILSYASLNIWTLLLSYFIYLLILFLVLHPAPHKCLEIYEVNLHNFSENNFANYIMNTLALVVDNDNFKPQITPLNLRGMIIYVLGGIIFYVLIANFVIRKITDVINIKD